VHTDDQGNEELDQFLSQQRGNADALTDVQAYTTSEEPKSVVAEMKERRRKYFWATSGVFVILGAYVFARLVMYLMTH